MDANNKPLIWKKVTYPGVKKDRYIVSENGDIVDIISLKSVSQYDAKDGYLQVYLQKEPKGGISVLAHRIVAYGFCENPNNYPSVDHIDGNKCNNHYTNLEWVTPKENTRRAIELGLKNDRGFNHASSIFTEEEGRTICEKLELGWGIKEIFQYMMNDPKARMKDNIPLYQFISRLKRRDGWENITKDYNYNAINERHKGKWFKEPPGTGRSYHSEEMIRDVCQRLENGDTVQDILEYYTGSRTQKDNRRMYDFIDGIRRKLIWTDISKDYKVENSRTYKRNSHWDDKIATMVDSGYTDDEIINTYDLPMEKGKYNERKQIRDKIRRMISRYKKFKKIDASATFIFNIHEI